MGTFGPGLRSRAPRRMGKGVRQGREGQGGSREQDELGHVKPMLSYGEGLGDLGRVGAGDPRRRGSGAQEEGRAGRGLGMRRAPAYSLSWGPTCLSWPRPQCYCRGQLRHRTVRAALGQGPAQGAPGSSLGDAAPQPWPPPPLASDPVSGASDPRSATGRGRCTAGECLRACARPARAEALSARSCARTPAATALPGPATSRVSALASR